MNILRLIRAYFGWFRCMAGQSAGISGQGSKFQIHLGLGSPKTITAITQANPGVVTSAAHGLVKGDVVDLAAIVGMVELNGAFALVGTVTTNTFELAGIDTTGMTAYGSGGTATAHTFSDLGEVRDFTPTDPGSADIEKTTVYSTAKEFVAGLPDNGTATCNFNYVPSDPALLLMWAARQAGNDVVFRFVFPFPTKVYAACKATVRKFSKLPTFGANVMLAGQGELRISGAVYTTY